MKLDNLREILRKNEAPRVVAPVETTEQAAAEKPVAHVVEMYDSIAWTRPNDDVWVPKSAPSFVVTWSRIDSDSVDVMGDINPIFNPAWRPGVPPAPLRAYHVLVGVNVVKTLSDFARYIRQAVEATSRQVVRRAQELQYQVLPSTTVMFANYDDGSLLDFDWPSTLIDPSLCARFNVRYVVQGDIDARWRKME